MATTESTNVPVSIENRFELQDAEYAILFDSSKCTACKGCQVACKCWNELPSPMELNSGEFTGSLQNPPDLSDDVRVIITFNEKPREDRYGVDWAFGRRACMHCKDAACVEVCPSGALYHHETGMVTYDADKCIGCTYCRAACPFDVPRHEHGGFLNGKAVINKCTGCVDRIEHGMAPACVSTCQPGALEFGNRDELLAKAHDRVDALKEKGFDQARVYGENEVGGTHVLYVLKYGIDQYDLPEDPQVSRMIDASNIMKPLTAAGAVAVVAGLGLCMIDARGYHRDHLHYDEVNHDVIDVETGEVVKHIDKEAGER